MASLDPARTALLLIGFQRDYFDPKGILYSVVEESHRVSGTLDHTLRVIESYKDTPMVMVNTPIVFSETYRELENPIGILKTIREVEAFKEALLASSAARGAIFDAHLKAMVDKLEAESPPKAA